MGFFPILGLLKNQKLSEAYHPGVLKRTSAHIAENGRVRDEI